jgi:hypothetical protein
MKSNAPDLADITPGEILAEEWIKPDHLCYQCPQ